MDVLWREPLLTPSGQTQILKAALENESKTCGHAHANADECASARLKEEMSSVVSRQQTHAGKQQVAAMKRKKPLKEQLKKVRQRLQAGYLISNN
jgi:hypothetical protein